MALLTWGTGKAGPLLVLALLLASSWSVAGGGEPRAGLPFDATGALGALDSSAHTIAFDTSAGRYSVDGVVQDGEARRESVGALSEGRSVRAFDFASIRLDRWTTVTATGQAPLVLLSAGSAVLDATFLLDGAPGVRGGVGAGGGGGGGGGAVAILARG